MSNSSQTNFRNVVKICIEAIWAMKFTISLSNLGFYIKKKIKLGKDLHVNGPLRKILRHQTEEDNNPYWLDKFHFSTIICTGINGDVLFFFSFWPTLHCKNTNPEL